jgi:MoxR-like ATPase
LRNIRSALLFDHPVRVIGTPGSGKTMMASLVEFRLVESILRDQSSENNRSLASVLASSGFTRDERPRIAAVRTDGIGISRFLGAAV